MQKTKKNSIGTLLPLIMVLAVIPLIVIIHMYDCGLEKNVWFSASGTVYDFFLYYKSRALIVVGIVLMCMIGWMIYKKRSDVWKEGRTQLVLIGLGCFVLFSFFSLFFAHNISDAFWGGYEQWEGFLVLFTYALIFLFAYAFLNHEQDIHLLIAALVIGATLVGTFGFFQAFHLDYIKSGWMHSILTSLESAVKNISVSLNFEEGMAYSTLYNPNYVGSFVSLTLPVLAGVVIWSKKLWLRIVAGWGVIALLVSLYFSQSLTGFIGLGGMAAVMIVFFIPFFKKHLKVTLISVAAFVVVAVGVYVAKPSVFRGVINKLSQSSHVASTPVIKAMTMKDNVITITTKSDKKVKVKVTYSTKFDYEVQEKSDSAIQNTVQSADNQLILRMAEGEKVSLVPGTATVQEQSIPILTVKSDHDGWNFIWYQSKLKHYNIYKKLDNMKEIPTIGFENNMTFATGRGYIWSRTIPMLTSHILVGCGADNFVYEFPNYDYVGKLNYGFNGQTMTKPHNMYLQIWVQDGLLALLGMLLIYILFAIDIFKNYFGKSCKGFLPNIALSAFFGVTAYMVVGMANDSTITTAPIFWALMGIGFAVTRIVNKQRQSELLEQQKQAKKEAEQKERSARRMKGKRK